MSEQISIDVPIPEKTQRVTRERKPRVVTEEKTKLNPEEVPYPKGGYTAGLTQLHVLLGFSLTPVLPETGKSLIENSEDCAKALDKWAQENPKVRRALNMLSGGSTIGFLAMAYWPIIATAAKEISSKRKTDDDEPEISNAESGLDSERGWGSGRVSQTPRAAGESPIFTDFPAGAPGDPH